MSQGIIPLYDSGVSLLTAKSKTRDAYMTNMIRMISQNSMPV